MLAQQKSSPINKSGKKKHPESKLKNPIPWFEIAVIDMDRARKFYEAVFDIRMEMISEPEFLMALFPVKGKQNGALILRTGSIPSMHGNLLYLNAGKNLDKKLERVINAGGVVLVPKTKVLKRKEYYAIISDTEGNKIGLLAREKNV